MIRRSGASLAGVVVFCLAAASLLTWLMTSLEWSLGSLTAERKRLEARAQLSSQIEICRRWVRSELGAGRSPRVAPGRVTGDPESRRVFESRGTDGAFAVVYDLESPPSGFGAAGFPLPLCPGGLLIRGMRPAGSSPSLEIETVWVTRAIVLPDGSTATVLDERPLIWRESWR